MLRKILICTLMLCACFTFQLSTSYADVTLPAGLTEIEALAFINDTKLNGMLTIPDGVTTIGEEAFAGCTGLTGMVLPDSVTVIEAGAFSGCTGLSGVIVLPENCQIEADSFLGCAGLIVSTGLPPTPMEFFTYEIQNQEAHITSYNERCAETEIVIPDIIDGYPVTKINNYVFDEASAITSARVPRFVTYIGEYGFYGCSLLSDIRLPNAVTYMGDSVFEECVSLTSISLPASLVELGASAFYCCDNLAEVTVPEGLKRIGGYSFYGCTSLKEMVIPQGVTQIEDKTFYACTSLQNVTIEGAVTNVGKQAFYTCTSLQSLRFPQGLLQIGERAFSCCFALQEAVLPDTVTEIAAEAFYSCKSLKSMTIPAGVVALADDLFHGCKCLESMTLPAGLKSIGKNCFRNCKSLLQCVIPDGVTEIGTAAFNNCTGLGSMTIPAGVTVLADNLFSYCESLESVTLPAGLKEIGSATFYRCRSLKSFVAPESLTSIGSKAFAGCILFPITLHDQCVFASDSFEPDSTVMIYGSDFNYMYGYGRLWVSEFDPACDMTEVTVPAEVCGHPVSSVGSDLFSDCTYLISVILPDTVTVIGYAAFDGCTGLTSITIPDGVTSIAGHAFSGCTSLTSITIPDSVISIGKYAFSLCTGLTSIAIPNGVTSINENVFYGCSSLTSITIPDSVTSIDACAFYDCSSLTSITIPDSVTSIGDRAFSYCHSLTNITIPDGVTSIGDCTFSSCRCLTSITIPDSVTSIEENAFAFCASTMVIYGESGSYAEAYAENKGFTFRAGAILASSRISGYVRLTNEAPLEGVEVTVSGDGGSATIYTNSNGYWNYSGEPYTTYTVTYAAQGYAIAPVSKRVYTNASSIFAGTVYASEDAEKLQLTAPVIHSPVDNAVVYESSVTVVWNAQPTAESYVVSVNETDVDGNSVCCYEDEITETSVTFSVTPERTYAISVCAQRISEGGEVVEANSTIGISTAAESSRPKVTGFTMSSSSVLTGAPVEFVVQTQNAALVQLVVDGEKYDVATVSGDSAVLTREFTLSGSREIAFRACYNGVWSEPCTVQMLNVSAEAELAAPAVTCPEKIWENQPLEVSWEAVEHATGYTVYLTDVNGGIVSWEYGANLRTITIPAEYFAAIGEYNVLVMAYAPGYSQSSTRIYVTVTDEYIPWTGWVQHTTVNTYDTAECQTINGYVDYLDPVTILNEENGAYLIEMTLTSGGTAQRYVLKSAIGTEPYSPDLTLTVSWSLNGEQVVLQAKTNLAGLCAGVQIDGAELGRTERPQSTTLYTKTFFFALTAPTQETVFTLWAEDEAGNRLSQNLTIPAYAPPTPTPTPTVTTTPAVTMTAAPATTPTATPTATPSIPDDVIQLPDAPSPTVAPTTCIYMQNDIHEVAVYALKDMYLLCRSDGTLVMQRAVCEECGASVSGNIPENITMQFYFHPWLRYYDTNANGEVYTYTSAYQQLSVNAPLTVNSGLYLGGGELNVTGKLTVEGELKNVSSIHCSELEIKKGGSLVMTEGGTITCTGRITINGRLTGADKISCDDRFYVGSNGVMAFEPDFSLSVGGRFEFHSNQSHADYFGGDSQITAAGMKIRGAQFQFNGTFVSTSLALDMNNHDQNYVEMLDLTPVGGLVDVENGKLVNRTPKASAVNAHQTKYIEMTYSAYEAYMDVLKQITEQKKYKNSFGEVCQYTDLKEPVMLNGVVDQVYYMGKVDDLFDETYGTASISLDVTISNGSDTKLNEAAMAVIDEALEDVEILAQPTDSGGIIRFGTIQYELSTGSDTISVWDDDNNCWEVTYNGLSSIVSSSVLSDKSKVRLYSGSVCCKKLGYTGRFVATSTKAELQNAASTIVDIGAEEIEAQKQELISGILKDAAAMLAKAAVLETKNWQLLDDPVYNAHKITTLELGLDVYETMDTYTELYGLFCDFKKLADNVVIYHDD